MDQNRKPLFTAFLYPNRSLDRRGYLILSFGTGVIAALYGIVFLTIGAWPIFGFLGAEWLLFWGLLTWHCRGDRRAESLTLYDDLLLIARCDAAGRSDRLEMPAYWLRAAIEKGRDDAETLILSSHGRRIEIGTFLAPAEKRDLAAALARNLALLRRADFSAMAAIP